MWVEKRLCFQQNREQRQPHQPKSSKTGSTQKLNWQKEHLNLIYQNKAVYWNSLFLYHELQHIFYIKIKIAILVWKKEGI